MGLVWALVLKAPIAAAPVKIIEILQPSSVRDAGAGA
jgi:hypothetical protein